MSITHHMAKTENQPKMQQNVVPYSGEDEEMIFLMTIVCNLPKRRNSSD
jgi:hypothetical protein